jgi:hypothetical protein
MMLKKEVSNRKRNPFMLEEKGQALVLTALLLFFGFLALAALAVDGTMIYLQRRNLQNIADAAALAAATQLSQNKDESAAYQTAMDNIEVNGGRPEWYSTDPAAPDPPNTNIGTGVDLTLGIQITDACDVRVALQWSDVGTYFAQLIGIGSLQVSARAHAGCNRAGGLQPIAIKRFGDERDWNFSLKNLNAAGVYCDDCNTQLSLNTPQGLGNATDFLRPLGQDEISEWPGWPGGVEMYESPSPHANLANGLPGREYFFLGSGTDPNVGTTSYAGLVNLDIRHVSAPPVEYYNGVGPGTQSNTLKDLAENYIRRGYCCEIPAPGDQVAVYNGNSTAFAAKAFQETYQIGDIVALIVYNGYVFNTPNLAMTGTPDYQATHPSTSTIASNVATYAIDLKAENGFQSSVAGLSMNVEGLDGFAYWKLSSLSPVLGHNGIKQHTLTLVITPTVTTVGTTTHIVTGTRMFYVSAIDNKTGGTGLHRYWAGIVTFGDTVNGIQRDKPAVTGTPTNTDLNYPFLSVVKGRQAKYSLDLDLWGNAGDKTVTVSSGALPTGIEWVSGPPWIKDVKYNSSKQPDLSFIIGLKVSDSASSSSTPYEIPLTVSAPGLESQTFKLYILVEEAQTTVKEYVEILGYAAVQVTGFYNNTNPVSPGQPANAVRGRIVSELWQDPSQLTYGLRARLIPWNQ